MKKVRALIAVLLAMLMLASCAPANNDTTDTTDATVPAGDTIVGEPLDLLAQLVTDTEVPVMCENAELTAENAEWLVGLTADDFADVEKAAVSMAMITSQAHMVALLKCKDEAAAATVKEKLQKQFDIRRWVCVIPELCTVIDSGSYVFFVASTVDLGETLLDGFTKLAGEKLGERFDVEGATGKVEIPA
ncbi:MAG: DUF4358 domain-containing protein [Clostridia bacterium]|nr:DUF4358 domain-containing protein [Clostridia bacterium]